ncbi:hypothetical protein J5N97_009765 [Dioscorea zingiberensis]|uniref:EF-hand domain-containing protein n=1 Tax=Dioscorea zingiberensis TaxID=325984 RepID=A0A9D5HLT1_9LILI|nr:hypothetical protein J5N97_009765 [Dioscorea zingiberensis]
MRCVVLPQHEMSIGEFKTWLKQFDMNHDGKISQEELRHALKSLHEWFAWWKAKQGVKDSDVNRNGFIDKEEISKLVIYAEQHLNMKIFQYY